MNEKFLELAKEKQLRIINAGMEVFGKYEYKKASTEEIAYKAGISKGLLFYYFKNKKSFYLYLYNFCMKQVTDFIEMEKVEEITDFFELMTYGSARKIALLHEFPYMTDFVIRAFYDKKESVSTNVDQAIEKDMSSVFDTYFKNINFSKFKDDVDPKQMLNMLTWMSEGYLFEKQRLGNSINIEEMMNDFDEWKNMFIKLAYKEEYQ